MSRAERRLAPRRRPSQARARETVDAILQAAAEVMFRHRHRRWRELARVLAA